MTESANSHEAHIIANLDTLTKQGQRLHVLKEITKLLKGGPSRALRPPLARLANRNHAYVLALRILHPIIREDRERKADAGAEALNIYATSLMWIGALEEAQECLHRIKGSTDALLTETFVHFARWDYQKAMPLLNRYIHSPAISPYQKLVGQINLLAAHIAVGNLDEAEEVFNPLHGALENNPDYKLLFGNCLELRAQIEMLRTSYESALGYLSESEKCLAGQPGRYLLYVDKWRALAKLGLAPEDPAALAALRKVKAEAMELKNWETLRDCDFHLARLRGDQELLQRILLGTPYRAYHERVEFIFNVRLAEGKTLEYCPGEPAVRPESSGLDLTQITDTGFLNSTSWPLIQIVTKDIYRPPRMGVVFSGLYKGEYFDPFTSPQRVRNSVFRFNDWANEAGCDFRIQIQGGDFRLVGPKGLGITRARRERPLADWQASLNVFKLQNESKSFTTAQVAEVLGITERSALNILQKGLASKKLQRIGRGKSSRYIFYSGRRAA